MLANFFDKTKPINSIVLSVLFFLLFTSHFFLSETHHTDYNHWGPALLALVLNFTFIFLSSYYFIKNKVSNENLHNTFIMILLYGLFPSAFLEINLILVSILYLLIYKNLAQLKIKERKSSALFDAGIYSGISFLLFPGSIVFLVFIFTSIILAKKIKLKNILGPILGFTATQTLFFSYCFITNNTELFLERTSFETVLNFDTYFKNSLLAPLIIFCSILGLSILATFTRVISISSPFRSQYGLAISMIFFGALSILMSSDKTGAELLLIFVPSSIIIGRFLKTISNRLTKDLFLIAFGFCSLLFLIKNS